MAVATTAEIEAMGPVKERIFQMRTDDDFLMKLDELRRADPGLPSRAEKLRMLVESAYREIEKPRAKK